MASPTRPSSTSFWISAESKSMAVSEGLQTFFTATCLHTTSPKHGLANSQVGWLRVACLVEMLTEEAEERTWPPSSTKDPGFAKCQEVLKEKQGKTEAGFSAEAGEQMWRPAPTDVSCQGPGHGERFWLWEHDLGLGTQAAWWP